MTIQPITIAPALAHAARVAREIPDLVRATGPVSYDYQFGRPLLEALVLASWTTAGTLYAASTSTLALAGDGDLLGLEIGFDGPDFYAFKAGLVGVAMELIEQGHIPAAEAGGLIARAEKASYLNAHIPDDVYYILVLATPERHRGKGAGAALLRHAIQRARTAGKRELQLDVLADNPAVSFYRAMGLEVAAETSVPELTQDHGFPAEYRMTMVLA